jgi:tetratricopeptide (TPR) repeat protein
MTQFLAEWALRSSILIVCGALLIRALRVKDPSLRLAAWTAILCGSLAIPALTAVLPKLPIAVMRLAPVRVEAPVIVQDDAPPPEREVPRPDARMDKSSPSVSPDIAAVPATPNSNIQVDSPSPSVSPSSQAVPAAPNSNVQVEKHGAGIFKRFDWALTAVMVYVLVALVLLLRLGFGLAISLRLLRRSRVTGQATEGIQIRESDRVTAPVALGIVRPAIVLPGDWRQWDSAKMKAVLAHERSHIRRHDPVVQLLSAIHRVLLWPTPLSWFLHRQIVRVAEEVGDDAAVAVTRDRTVYAEVLLDFMRRGVWRANWQGVPISRYGLADMRIHRILNGTAVSRGVTKWGLAAILALGLPLAYLAATAQPQSEPQAQVTPVQSRQWTPFEADMVDRQYLAGNTDPVSIENYVYARRDDGSWVKSEQILPNGKQVNQRIVEDYSTRTHTSIDPSMKALIKYPYSAKDVDYLSTPPAACGNSNAPHVEIQGYDTVEVRFTVPGDGKGFPVTEWRAPRLNCFALKHEMVLGSSTLTREALDVNEGAPAGSLFEIPTTYTEFPSKGLEELKREKAAGEHGRSPNHAIVGGQDRIESIFIRGNDRIPASVLLKSISIHAGDLYDPEKIERDVTALKNTGYLDDVGAQLYDAPAGTNAGKLLIFNVHEKTGDSQVRIEAIVIRGYRRIPASTIRKSISNIPGDIYDPAKIERDVTALMNTGYFDAVREETSYAPAGMKGGPEVIFYVREKKDAAAKQEAAPVQPAETPSPAVAPPLSALERETRKRITMGDFNVARGEYDYAIDFYEEGLQLDPSNIELRQKLRGAIKACSKEVAILNNGLKCGSQYPAVPPLPAPGSPRLPSPAAAPSPALERETRKRITMGDFHLARGEYDEAIAMYEEGLQLDPSNREVHRKLDNAIRNCQKEEDLLHEGLSCARTRPVVTPSPAPGSPPHPSHVAAPDPAVNRKIRDLVNMGNFHLARGEYDEAITMYEEGLQLDPSNSEVQRKLHNAIRACQKEENLLPEGVNCGGTRPVVTPSPAPGTRPIPHPAAAAVSAREVKAKINMGDFHLGRGEYDEAITSYDEGLQLDPSNTTLRQKLNAAVKACQKQNSILNEGMNCAAPSPVPSAQGQEIGEAKMVLISPDHSRDAVKVIKITANGEPIHPGRRRIPEIPGKRFAAGDDWIRNLSFVLKNLTSLNIVFVSIDVGFPEAAEYTFNIKLGQVPSPAVAAYFNRPRAVIPTGTGHPLQFGPGQEIPISLSAFADAIKEEIEVRMPFSNVTKCSIVVDHVYFEDKGLKWGNFGFGYAMPDSTSPSGYERQPWDYFPGDLDQTTGQN